jgi:GAF domain-containing protein
MAGQMNAPLRSANLFLHQGKLIGILYLENRLLEGTFTANRLELLKIFSGTGRSWALAHSRG